MREQSSTDRTIPVFVTLLVVAFVTMTFDIRSSGGGVLGSFRAGTNQLIEPLEAAATAVVNPIADLVGNLGDIAGLRAENQALRARLAEAQAQLAAVEDQLERLEVLERLHSLQLDVRGLVTTNANVIGRTDSFDMSFRIDRGEESGVLAGHPVLDANGYLVGRVLDSWNGGATVVPLVGDVEGATVGVGDQVGSLTAVIGSELMTLEVLEGAKPVRAGAQVVTSTFSASFPPSVPVGEVIADAEPQGGALTAWVRPFSDPERLRVVVVVAWPPDPAAASADDAPAVTTPQPVTPTTGGDE